MIEAMDILDLIRWLCWLLRSGETPLDVAKRRGKSNVTELPQAKGGAGLHVFQRVQLAASCSVQAAGPSAN